jgi:hypothetical protein
LTLIEQVPVVRFGKLLNTVQIYYAEGFDPSVEEADK